ncbi:MAG: O-methyltransferase [Actinomycetota bacterium]|nr:O-methyltransferase [Actinomycetota bacterium]
MADTEPPPMLRDDIAAYVAAHTGHADDVLQRLIDTTLEATGDRSRMQISPDEGSLITLLTKTLGARHAIEVGTFTGYSSICIARGLAPGGRLLCLDVSEEYTAHALRAWAEDGLDDVIELRLGPALDSLAALEQTESFDLAFIDADKGSYLAYYEALLPRVRSGGLVLVDNTLWSGRVVALPSEQDDADTMALRTFNDAIAGDSRVESFILPIRDGLTLIRKL